MPAKDEIQISVRGLVEFILRHGDIDNRGTISPEAACREGSRIHRMIQKSMGGEYTAEVPLRLRVEEEDYCLTIDGRADGIIHTDNRVVIDEIKGTYRNPAGWKEPLPLHLAQAKCYAYIYALQNELREIEVRLTYCHIPTEKLTYFYSDYEFGELERWFEELLDSYKKWAAFTCRWKKIRQASIKKLQFPFPYREGQKELVTNVYRTIYHKKKLFLEAPTGVGKTISTVFPAVQAMGQNMGEKIFYLTAKTITRTVADDTFQILREKGLQMKSVILTAKEKICFMDEVNCNPEYCPYAKGHFDRINDAVYDLLTHEDSFSRELIELYAMKHRVCPFEMCLDMSLFADAIICDYNYLFDPNVYLKRFFAEGISGDYIFLIDEAHNLLERGREMYSAVLLKESFLELRRELKLTLLSETSSKGKKKTIKGQMMLDMTNLSMPVSQVLDTETGELTEMFSENSQDSEDDDSVPAQRSGGKSVLVRKGYAEKIIHHLEKCNREMLALKRQCPSATLVESIEAFVQPLLRLQGCISDYLEEPEAERPPVREEILDFYFEVSHFLEMYELLDENYVKYSQLCDDGDFMLKLFCVNPAVNLERCMKRGRSTILFSATFLPIQYYKKLLGGNEEDYEVYAQSVFNPAKRALFMAEDVTTRYTRRSEEEYSNIAAYIEEIVKNRHGNYMVFCPSYAFLRTIYEKYTASYQDEDRECIIQGDSMNEADREEFLNRFRENDSEKREKILIGFCVLGGIFSEGIDLKNDSLIGTIIVGTGLPQVCFEREILKNYFDENGEDGFAYSYRYPGMNKVLQAAGRVIRTTEDVGIIALLDERFGQYSYRKLFPREWEFVEIVDLDTVSGRVEKFWDEWL
ncbi:MAG: ATP-dependent DNA helicase [Acetatifactor sp.]|nr:ATP-dependent DNA helicase [Acetatifactor sp.]